MKKLPLRERVARAVYAWDVTTDPDRTPTDYLEVTGRIISIDGSTATVDDAWMLIDVISAWDKEAGEVRTRGDYLRLADRILAGL